MIQFNFKDKKLIHNRRMTEFSCMSTGLDGAELHTLGEITYNMPDSSFNDDYYRGCQKDLELLKRALAEDFVSDFMGKSDMAIIKSIDERIKAFKDENFRIDFISFVHFIKEEWEKFMKEEFEEFLEYLAPCRPNKTGLPVNIFIDETEEYKHGNRDKRIRFQINRKVKFHPFNSCPMTLDGKISEDVWNEVKKDKTFDITDEHVEAVRNFVINNAYALDKVADQLLWLDKFWEICIKGGEKATDSEIQEMKNKTDSIQ